MRHWLRTPLPRHASLEALTDLRHLSDGAFALTYRATAADGGGVVLKELFPLGATRLSDGSIAFAGRQRETLLDGFLKEAITMHALVLPQVPRLHRHFEANRTQYLVMEDVTGLALSDWCRGVFRRRDPRAASLMADCFAALLGLLSSLEAIGMVHGDVAPRNLVMEDGVRPRLLDFGAAFHLRDPVLSRLSGHPGYRPRDAVHAARRPGPWLDIHGLCASFYDFLAGTPPFEQEATDPAPLRDLYLANRGSLRGAGLDLIDAIERGLVRTGLEPVATAGELLAILGDGAVASPTTTREERMPPQAEVGYERYQSCLLQSFDTARFRYDDREWLKRRNGAPLVTSTKQKIALARTEALLNICFGREIVVPAGQIADSPAFEAVFNEIHAAYAPRRIAIAEACARLRMPEWRPFRVGLENRSYVDYAGFTRAYRYTGADLVALAIEGEDAEREKQTGELLAEAAKLFGQGRFVELGDLIRTKTGRQGFEVFARSVSDYFDASASVFAEPGVPEVAKGEYAELFAARLGEQRTTGRGGELAIEMIEPTQRILSLLSAAGLKGYRGNWYFHRREFRQNWQLARAYLDFRLFMNLSRIYAIDHPILVSQVFEYGRYDHCVFLGPRFGQEREGDPRRETQLIELVGKVADRIDWDGVMEMFLDDHFLKNVALMTDHYFRGGVDDGFYQNLIQAHGAYLARHAGGFISVDLRTGLVSPAGGDGQTGDRDVFIQAVEASMRTDAATEMAAANYESVTHGMNEGAGYALIAIAPLDADGLFNLGAEMADQLLNYYIKPYRLMANRRL